MFPLDRPVVLRKSDNTIFRLDDDLSVRLARRNGPVRPGGKECDWLPRLAPLLPFDIPVPVAQGRPTSEYPWFWNIYTWVDGETVPVEDIDAIQAARELAAFVAALRKVDPARAPTGRGIPLAKRDAEVRYWLARFSAGWYGMPVISPRDSSTAAGDTSAGAVRLPASAPSFRHRRSLGGIYGVTCAT